MGRELLCTPLNGSTLVAWLSRHALVDGPDAMPSFVDGMARWVGWADAIPLAAALHAPPGPCAATPPTASTSALDREIERVRASLIRSIENDASLARDADFAQHRRHCVRQQQAMERAVTALRSQARTAVAQQSPALSRLAAIDTVMADVIGPREQHLLAMIPSVLERHFLRLSTHDDAVATRWLDVFRRDMRQLLLAELDLRLQPVEGLREALGHQIQHFDDQVPV